MSSVFIDKDNATDMFQQLWQQCKSEVYCDVVLIADSSSIPAHRNILAAASEYFRAMFTSPMLESTLREIAMPSVQHGILRSLIEFIYTGFLEIRTDNAIELLKTANMLLLHKVVTACENFLITELHASNCFGFAALAEQYNCSKLLHKAKAYCYKHFMEASETEEFKSLSLEKLREILASDELCVSVEEDVFNSLMKWIRHDQTGRDKYMGQLLNLVRLPLLEKSFLINTVKPLCNSKECLDLYMEAIEWHILPDRKVLYKRSPTFMMAMTINGTLNEMYIHYYCTERLKWMKSSNGLRYRKAFGIAVNANELFILGGRENSGDTLNTVLCLNLETMNSTAIAPMLETRDGFRATFLNGFLYAVGGVNSSSVEKWDPETNRWTIVAAMSTHRWNFGIAVLNEKLYVVGGVFAGNNILNTAECYDPELNLWKPIKAMNERRLLPGVSVANGLLYAVGGSNNEKSVERYDPQIDNWSKICALAQPLYGIQSCLSYRNKVVLCYRNRIVEYDTEANKWIETALSNEVNSIYRLFSYSNKLLRSAFSEN